VFFVRYKLNIDNKLGESQSSEGQIAKCNGHKFVTVYDSCKHPPCIRKV